MKFGLVIAGTLLSSQLLAATSRGPVLVELFTSQGCSSCPPAETLFKDLDETQPLDGVELIPLVFHVDYWDRLGWKDPYAAKSWSQRQYDYAAAWKTTRVYTPQAVVNGRNAIVGHDRTGILKIAEPVRRLEASFKNGKLEIYGLIPGWPLWVALTEEGLENEVPAGENSGRRLIGHAVVRRLEYLAYKGKSAYYTIPPGSEKAAVFFQQASFGPVAALGRYKFP